MLINLLSKYTNVNSSNKIKPNRTVITPKLSPFDSVHFKGNTQYKKVYAFDLDGAFAEGSNPDIQETVSKVRAKNGLLVYATSRTVEQLYKLIDDKAKDGVKIPLPDVFAGGNGQHIYKNINGEMVEDKKWALNLKTRNNFHKTEVYNLIKSMGQEPQYKLSDNKLSEKSDLDEYKKRDPDFWNSKISYYEFCPSDLFLEFMVANDGKEIKTDIEKAFEKKNIKADFLTNTFPKSNLDKYCSADILDKARPMRINDEGGLYTIHIGASTKGEAVKYIAQEHNIPMAGLVGAGDGHNDKSLAALSKEGAKFIALPATDYSGRELLDYVEKMSEPHYQTDFRNPKIETAFHILNDDTINTDKTKGLSAEKDAIVKKDDIKPIRNFLKTDNGKKLIVRTYIDAFSSTMPDEYPATFGLYIATNNIVKWMADDLDSGKLNSKMLKRWTDKPKEFSNMMDNVIIANSIGTKGIKQSIDDFDDNENLDENYNYWAKTYNNPLSEIVDQLLPN